MDKELRLVYEDENVIVLLLFICVSFCLVKVIGSRGVGTVDLILLVLGNIDVE